MENQCYTYFKIVGDFNPDAITKMLGIQPEKSWKTGDIRKNGTKYDFSFWSAGRCDDYDIEIENQMQKTISILLDKIELLNQIKNENKVSFYLQIVPTIYVENDTPCLAPSLDVIDFCYKTRTKIDIDLYVDTFADKIDILED